MEAFSSYKLADTLQGNPKANPYIEPGDIVTLPEATMIYVVGNVYTPLTIPLKEPITLSRAVAMAGGVKQDSKKDKVRIVRQEPGSTTSKEIIADLSAIERKNAEDIALLPNDIVDVPTSGAKSFHKKSVGNRGAGRVAASGPSNSLRDDGRRMTDDGQRPITYKFQSLEIYQLALDYLALIYETAEKLPRSENFNLNSQLTRAATSVALNIAEGSTSQSDAEQSRFLGMALRSLVETVACLDIIEMREYVTSDDLSAQRKLGSKLFAKIQSMKRFLKQSQPKELRSADWSSVDGRRS